MTCQMPVAFGASAFPCAACGPAGNFAVLKAMSAFLKKSVYAAVRVCNVRRGPAREPLPTMRRWMAL